MKMRLKKKFLPQIFKRTEMQRRKSQGSLEKRRLQRRTNRAPLKRKMRKMIKRNQRKRELRNKTKRSKLNWRRLSLFPMQRLKRKIK